jgi:acylphosphatase
MSVKNFSETSVIQRHVWVSGRVQGVSFRASTVAEARRLGGELRGYVRNLEDGRVEAVLSGPQSEVLALVAWCRQGPPHAQVTRLEVREEPVDSSLPVFGIDY